MSEVLCPSCNGERLKPESLSVTVQDINISEFCKMSVVDALHFTENMTLTERDMMIGQQILKEIGNVLVFTQRRTRTNIPCIRNAFRW